MLGVKQARFSLPQRNERNCTSSQLKYEFKFNTLDKDTVSFNGNVVKVDALTFVSEEANKLKGTNASAYLDSLGLFIKRHTGTNHENADFDSQIVESKYVDIVRKIHNELLGENSNADDTVKDCIRKTFDRKLGSDNK